MEPHGGSGGFATNPGRKGKYCVKKPIVIAGLLWAGILAAALTGVTPAAAATAPAAVPAPAESAGDFARTTLPAAHRLLLEAHCFKCHAGVDPEASVRLDDLRFTIDDVETAERWQKVLGTLNSGEMPPAEEPRPDALAKTELLDDLSRALQAARRALADTGGAITMRRLNRREYARTIRSLVGIDIDVSQLPDDDGIGAFDTIGSALFMSSDQFETYLALGRRAIDDAFAAAGGRSRSVHVEPETDAIAAVEKAAAVYRDDHERYLRWKAAVDAAAALPENVETAARLRADAKWETLFYHEHAQLETAPPPTDFGFKDAADAIFRGSTQYDQHHRYHADYLSWPARQTGAYLTIYKVRTLVGIAAFGPPGTYMLRVRAAAVDAAPANRRFIEVGYLQQPTNTFTPLSSHEVRGTMAEPAVIEVPLSLTSTSNRRLCVRERQPLNPGASYEAWRAAWDKTGSGPEPAIWIDWLEVQGPLPPAAEVVDFVRNATIAQASGRAEADVARDVLAAFVRRAFRGAEPEPGFIDSLVGLYENQRAAGMRPDLAIREPLAVVLASPGFLYLAEPGRDRTSRPLDGRELAVRLAYFLWSSPPDDRLLELGRLGGLDHPDVLAREVDRLLDDPRAMGFCTAFPHQWLKLDRLDFFTFNTKKYRGFDESMKDAARREVYETLAHLVRTNGSLSRLLASDTAIVNSLLALHYGLDGVDGDGFRPVTLASDSPRGGLVGMAAVLAMGSDGERTNPIVRGTWVLDKLLDDPPPPAPPNVPQISRLDGQPLGSRERFALHRTEPQCLQCHRRIDPIGFGLENFDAVGRWREIDTDAPGATAESGPPVDASGAFFGGPAFASFAELRAILATQEEAFARGFTKALVEYALGRPCGFSDEQLIDEIVTAAAADDYETRSFIHALVNSPQFRSK
jgi:hypothetical protein